MINTIIKRAERSENDVLIPLSLKYDKRLNFMEKGLMVDIMLSRQFYVTDKNKLYSHSGVTQSKFDKCWGKLEECGYLKQQGTVYKINPFAGEQAHE